MSVPLFLFSKNSFWLHFITLLFWNKYKSLKTYYLHRVREAVTQGIFARLLPWHFWCRLLGGVGADNGWAWSRNPNVKFHTKVGSPFLIRLVSFKSSSKILSPRRFTVTFQFVCACEKNTHVMCVALFVLWHNLTPFRKSSICRIRKHSAPDIQQHLGLNFRFKSNWV